jgi:RNA polymerase sigma-70 factor (ECF subfamily)
MAEHQTATRERSDEELIAAFQQGDETAFNLLVGRYKDSLMNFVYRYLGDFDDADDVVQETFVRLFRSGHAYKPVAKFSTWLYTIATNLAKSYLRRRRRHSVFSLSRRGDERQGKDFDIPDNRYAADRMADSSIQEERIQQALNSINPKYRQVVVLCDVQELSYEEICQVTGLNMGTVKSRLNRARAQLQELLKDMVDG